MVQLTLFDAISQPVLERLRDLDPDPITPMEALKILTELVEEAR